MAVQTCFQLYRLAYLSAFDEVDSKYSSKTF